MQFFLLLSLFSLQFLDFSAIQSEFILVASSSACANSAAPAPEAFLPNDSCGNRVAVSAVTTEKPTKPASLQIQHFSVLSLILNC